MFDTYAQAQDWMKAKFAEHGQRAFTSTEEYKQAYTTMLALHKAENPKYKRPNRATAKRVGSNVNLLAFSLKNA